MTQFYMRDSRGDTGNDAMFWADGGGYTPDLGKAQLFDLEQAQRQHDRRCGDDVPLLKELVDKKTIVTVDFQKLPLNSILEEHKEFVIQVNRYWDGNDIYFVCGSNKTDIKQNTRSTHYLDALVVTLEEAQQLIAVHPDDYAIHPKSLLDAIARRTFHSSNIDLKSMCKKPGIKIHKPEKPKRERYRCDACGVFVSEEEFYGSVYHGHPCKNCKD